MSPVIAKRRAFIQQFFESRTERPSDVRVYMVGDCAVGAMRRYAPEDDWRTNVALGGEVEDITSTLDRRAVQLARRATEILNLDYAGVDLIRNEDDSWYVLEVNATAGFKGLFTATGTSPAAYIAQPAIEAVGGSVDAARVDDLATTLDDSVPACKPSVGRHHLVPNGRIHRAGDRQRNGRDGDAYRKGGQGAKRTSIDTEVIATIEAGPVTGTTRVKSGASKSSETRPLVDIDIRLGTHWQTVTASVDDRSQMSYPVLLGRDVLTGRQVDVGRRVDAE